MKIKGLILFHVKLLILLFIVSLSFAQTTTTRIEVKPLPPLPPVDTPLFDYVSTFPELSKLGEPYKEWYYWINYSRQHSKSFWTDVIDPILKVYPHLNTRYAKSLKEDLYRTSNLLLIKPNPSLLKVSQLHAFDLGKNAPGKISHNSTNGTAFEKRIFAAGIKNCAAENISLGPYNTVLALIMLYIDEGLPDTGHRNNLLSPYYTEMGVGIAKSKGDAIVVVQDFACDQGK